MVETIKKEYKIIDFIIFTPKKIHYQSYKNGPQVLNFSIPDDTHPPVEVVNTLSLQRLELIFQEVEVPHVHPEPLLGVGGVVLALLGGHVVARPGDALGGGGHGGLALQQLRGLAEDHLWGKVV